MAIGFNSKFFIEMLSNLDVDEVVVNMSVPSRAAIINPIDGLEDGEKITMLVMPLMLS
jgi:DNA polymerase-3 subunit beta